MSSTLARCRQGSQLAGALMRTPARGGSGGGTVSLWIIWHLNGFLLCELSVSPLESLE